MHDQTELILAALREERPERPTGRISRPDLRRHHEAVIQAEIRRLTRGLKSWRTSTAGAARAGATGEAN